jgi:hypothetical protein
MRAKPKPNMTESVLARAELYRRGMMFAGVPQMSSTELELPAAGIPGDAAAVPGAADPAAPLPAVPAGTPETTDELVAGAIKHESPLETIVAGA